MSRCLSVRLRVFLPLPSLSVSLSTSVRSTSPVVQTVAKRVHGGVLHELLHVLAPLRRAGGLAVRNERRDGVWRPEAVLFLPHNRTNRDKPETRSRRLLSGEVSFWFS